MPEYIPTPVKWVRVWALGVEAFPPYADPVFVAEPA